MYTIGLRRLILWLCVLSVGVAAANSLYVGYQVQRDILISGTLESNRAYAAKLADTTNSMLENSRGVLEYSAQVLGQDFSPATLEQEVRRVRHQTHYFNSVVIVDAQAMVRATSPSTLGLVGKRLDTAAARSALQARSPLTTEPYVSATGRWTTGLFHPIMSADGDFLGYITGSIYLHEPNILHNLLTSQVHRDGSYVYVVGQSGTLIYHPD
nr:cache domain-containing protein [Pseudomonas sp.]